MVTVEGLRSVGFSQSLGVAQLPGLTGALPGKLQVLDSKGNSSLCFIHSCTSWAYALLQDIALTPGGLITIILGIYSEEYCCMGSSVCSV